MNPNLPYGPGQMPMSPHQRRHDMPYRPHPGYQQHYYQPMGPMMPQYQHYQQPWYPPHYQYQHQHQHPHQQPYHGQRPPYYQPPMHGPPPPHMQQPHQGPLIVHGQMPPTPRGYPPSLPYPNVTVSPRRPSLMSNGSLVQTHTPPSRPISQTSAALDKRDDLPIVNQATPARASPAPSKAEVQAEPFHPPLPWLSVPDAEFPSRAPRGKRCILRSNLHHEPQYFPPESAPAPKERQEETPKAVNPQDVVVESQLEPVLDAPTPAETPTTVPSESQSDHMSTQPTTPSSAVATTSQIQQTPTQQKPSRAMPILPVLPVLPQSPTAMRKAHRDSVASTTSKAVSEVAAPVEADSMPPAEVESAPAPAPPPAPKSWADLVRKQGAANGAAVGATTSLPVTNGLTPPKSEGLGDVLGEIHVADAPSKVAFLRPRGLVNTGNMCYMNSILQVLVFCIPFYDFLDRVAQKAAHNFKSLTPLVDAMIMFMKEYPSIDTATTVGQLRLRLKPEDFEKYGDPLRPDFVYETINKLPRFRDMRRGHQQDAQEFLGFLLEELHEECTLAMHRTGTSVSSGRSTPVGSVSNMSENVDTQDGWLEVGHKQKSSITRSSGADNSDSPVTNLFRGKLRSELKIAGSKLSVTLEQYQPLQLDIGSPQVSNIIDALKGLTKPESMQGDFHSARGTQATATKQVFIETLPPVLILHLKRFEYNSNTKRAEKIWKKVGYPLQLEIPKEVFPPNSRNKFAAHGGLPKYRLTGVIYHHGKNANGGHYTVDIRRQDEREWIRLDDTVIRRIRSEDVAEGGSEEDPKVLAAALEQHKKQAKESNNRYENIEADEDDEDSGIAWSQVANGHGRSKSTMNTVVNGSATPAKDASGPQTPRYKDSVKDNKVAYLLFYQRI